MNVIDELRKRGKRPYNLSEEEFDAFYANLYNVLALEGRVGKWSIIFLIGDAIEMYRLREAGYDKED